MDLARTTLEIKRKVIQRHMDAGLFPYTKRYLGTLRNHFSTIGVNGINEMIRNFTNDEHDITDGFGQAKARPTVWQKKTKNATPALFRRERNPRRITRTRRSCPSALRTIRSPL